VTPSLETTGFGESVLPIGILRFAEDDCGQDMIEYALIAAGIGLASIAGVNGIATHISSYMRLLGAGFDASI
jgi:Flp pilus assembly pilin Flp